VHLALLLVLVLVLPACVGAVLPALFRVEVFKGGSCSSDRDDPAPIEDGEAIGEIGKAEVEGVSTPAGGESSKLKDDDEVKDAAAADKDEATGIVVPAAIPSSVTGISPSAMT
jgi:hypothetical protein